MTIDINNESGAEVDEVALADLSRFVLDTLGVNALAELSIVLVDEVAMASLHEQWMDLPGPTDVMAFPQDALDDAPGIGGPHGPTLLGDVVLCPQVAATQAAAAGHSMASELFLLTTHGILHLLGYDHDDAEAEADMFQQQATLVHAWTEKTGRSRVKVPIAGTAGEQRH